MQCTYQVIHTAFTKMILSIVGCLLEVRQCFLKVEPKKIQDTDVVKCSSNVSLVVILILLFAPFRCFLERFCVNGDNFFIEFECSFNLVVLEGNKNAVCEIRAL